MVDTFRWRAGALEVLNQLRLPQAVAYIRCATYHDVARAITSMAVRGAPAIGVVAAYGMALAAKSSRSRSILESRKAVRSAAIALAATRPTAVNLFWAIDRMERRALDSGAADAASLFRDLLSEADRMREEDIQVNRKIGAQGASLLKKNAVVLTHCNAGALATAGYGTALGVIRAGYAAGRISLVYVDETRPYLQGARLTAWELQQEKIPYRLITDNMAAHIMRTAGVSAVIVGADRIARNGDVANKIGTYGLSILARYHGIPLYVAAPLSTIDLATRQGNDIPIEERASGEVTMMGGRSIAPRGAIARHPGFDITPARNITGIITERGVLRPSEIKHAPVRNT